MERARWLKVSGERRKLWTNQQQELKAQRMVGISKLLPVPPGGGAVGLATRTGARGTSRARFYRAERENSLGLNEVPSSQSVQRVRRILRWVLSRACVLDPVRRRLAW